MKIGVIFKNIVNLLINPFLNMGHFIHLGINTIILCKEDEMTFSLHFVP
jgi:hypothetical protein